MSNLNFKTVAALVVLVSSVPAVAMESSVVSTTKTVLDFPDSDRWWPYPRLIRVNDEARLICIAACLALGTTPFVGPAATAACVAACPAAIRH